LKIYISHNYAARDWLRELVVPYFEKQGHSICARWITEPEASNNNTTDWLARNLDATKDLQDIDACDVFIYYVEQYGATPGKGKHTELGYALALNKRIIAINPKLDYGNVFVCASGIKTVMDELAVITLGH